MRVDVEAREEGLRAFLEPLGFELRETSIFYEGRPYGEVFEAYEEPSEFEVELFGMGELRGGPASLSEKLGRYKAKIELLKRFYDELFALGFRRDRNPFVSSMSDGATICGRSLDGGIFVDTGEVAETFPVSVRGLASAAAYVRGLR